MQILTAEKKTREIRETHETRDCKRPTTDEPDFTDRAEGNSSRELSAWVTTFQNSKSRHRSSNRRMMGRFASACRFCYSLYIRTNPFQDGQVRYTSHKKPFNDVIARPPARHAEERQIDFKGFPSTRYQGSKRKILPWIYGLIKDLEFQSVLDVFGGTGSVSYLLKKMGKDVTYNDHLRFNYLIGVALIENDTVKLSPAQTQQLICPPDPHATGFVSNTFRGYYFTERENQYIDAVTNRIEKLNDGTEEGELKAAGGFYALFQTCLIKRPFNLFHRKNLYLRLARLKRSFGNKTTWDRRFTSHFKDFVEEFNSLVFQGKGKCAAINCDALQIPRRDFDLVYVDPPYVTNGKANETSDYRRCYHFLEGIANYSDWGKLVDFTTPNRRVRAAENRWVDSKQNLGMFDELLEAFSKSILVISYKRYGAPSISTLLRLVKRHGKSAHIHSRHYKYALNHQNGEAHLNREVLLICK